MKFSETRQPAKQHIPFGGRGGLLTDERIEQDRLWEQAIRNKNRPLSNKQRRSRKASKTAKQARKINRN